MVQLRFLNRNRPNWRLALAFIVVTVASLAGVTGLAGCGNRPASVLSGTVTGLKAGIYTGSISCQNTGLDNSSGVLVESSDSQQLTATISSSGLPIVDGQEVRQGLVSTINVGGLLEATAVITDITFSDNGVIVDSDIDLSVTACLDTCQFAFDGECDDGGPGAVTVACDFGTDCFDCGGASTVDAQGTMSKTYKLFGIDRIDYRNTLVIGEEFGTFFLVKECQGILVP